MKKKMKLGTRYFIGIAFTIIYVSFISCQNNDTPDKENLTVDKLVQTAWRGTVHCNGWNLKDWNIGIQFINDKNGGASYYPTSSDPYDSMQSENFSYTLNGKLLFFKDSGLLEGGPWTVVSYDGQHLTLKQNISSADPNNVATMELGKVD